MLLPADEYASSSPIATLMSVFLLARDMLVHLIPEAEAVQAASRTSNPHAAAASDMSTPALDRHGRPQLQQAPAAPGIMFKAASVIREELIMCKHYRQCFIWCP